MLHMCHWCQSQNAKIRAFEIKTWYNDHIFKRTDIILPSGLNSSSRIFAISCAHIDSVTVIYLLPITQDKSIDMQEKGEWRRKSGKIQHHVFSYSRSISYQELLVTSLPLYVLQQHLWRHTLQSIPLEPLALLVEEDVCETENIHTKS